MVSAIFVVALIRPDLASDGRPGGCDRKLTEGGSGRPAAANLEQMHCVTDVSPSEAEASLHRGFLFSVGAATAWVVIALRPSCIVLASTSLQLACKCPIAVSSLAASCPLLQLPHAAALDELCKAIGFLPPLFKLSFRPPASSCPCSR
jgi:hypothetical protein